jgi:hypothetical protein
MRRVIRWLIVIALGLVLLPYALTPLYSFGHPVSTLMIARFLSGEKVTRSWVDLDAMTPALPRTVVAAEDARFCFHHGVDWDAVRDVIEDAGDGELARGVPPSPSRSPRTCSCGRAAASSARRSSSRWRCGSTWCCRRSASWNCT